MKKGIRTIIVSTGRCGTTRIAEILQAYLPDHCIVVHQTAFSQLANVIGNIQYHFPIGEALGNYLYNKMFKSIWSEENNFISVDPLSPMIVPRSVINSEKTFIIHLVRDAEQFAASMFRLTRNKRKSFVAHNFIPFWQPYLIPLENILSRKILVKYRYIHAQKNRFFESKFSTNPNYRKIPMQNIFQDDTLSQLFSEILGAKIEIPPKELLKRANQTVTE